MNPVVKFLASMAGRVVRIVAGIALIAVGLAAIKGVGGVIVAVVGAVPLVAGVFDVCVFSPLFGGPFTGQEIRALE